ncbi:SMP-30/gluconolactonase/LRE family protein [Sphingomonas sp. MMS24-JH45]
MGFGIGVAEGWQHSPRTRGVARSRTRRAPGGDPRDRKTERRHRPRHLDGPMTDYLDATLDLTLVCDGLEFPEGPVWMADGSVLVVEIKAGRLTPRDAGRGATDGRDGRRAERRGDRPRRRGLRLQQRRHGVHRPADGGTAPIGAAPDHRGGSIQRVDLATGGVTTLYRDCDGRALNSPNDLVFDSHGGFWFTDLGRTTEAGHDIGHVYYGLPDGSAIRHVRAGLHSPNGIGLSPPATASTSRRTITSRIWCHAVTGPGTIAASDNIWMPGEVLGPLPGYQLLDSMAIDAAGNICAATLIRGGITVFAPDGSRATHHAVPDLATTNICFGGADMRDAWITASNGGRLYRTRWRRTGPAAGVQCISGCVGRRSRR